MFLELRLWLFLLSEFECSFCDFECSFCECECSFCEFVCLFCEFDFSFCDFECSFCDFACSFCDFDCLQNETYDAPHWGVSHIKINSELISLNSQWQDLDQEVPKPAAKCTNYP